MAQVLLQAIAVHIVDADDITVLCSLGDIGDPASLLQVWAPALLRRLYERDGRLAFCPPALWLAPFQSQYAGSDQGILSQPCVDIL